MSKPIYHFEMAALEGTVNEKDGVIEGVSVITGGVQAKGHNLQVDETTLEQMRALGEAKGQVPVKWNHKSGADAVNGFLTNFRVKGNKLKADWHLLKSHGQFAQAMELATRMAKNVGLSASFMGLSELTDGTKVYNPDTITKVHYTLDNGVRLPVARDVKIFARCEDLISVDLVATPAANPDGMFEAVDTRGEDMADKLIPGAAAETDDSAKILLGEFRQFAADVNTRLTNLEADEDEEIDDEDLDDEEDEDGEDGEDGEGAAPSEFRSVGQVLQYFEARLDQMADDKERQEFEQAYQAIEFQVGDLVAVNEQLLSENSMLAEAYQMLAAKTKNTVEFSAGADGKPRPVVRESNGRKATAFEARVDELKLEGKSPADALCFAVEEDSERYQIHLQSKGVFQTV